jgi:hypothetical protein
MKLKKWDLKLKYYKQIKIFMWLDEMVKKYILKVMIFDEILLYDIK